METRAPLPISHHASSHSLNQGYIRIPDSSDSDEPPTAAMKMDFLARRRKGFSSSSSSLSPTAPTLEAPSTFKVSVPRSAAADATIRARYKPEGVIAMPSMFHDDNEDEEDDKVVHDVTRGAPADPSPARVEHRSTEGGEVNQAQTQHYEEAFATRGPHSASKTQVTQDSILIVEIKINARIQDDESLAADLSHRMGQIYQRSESSILVTVQQKACLTFGEEPLPAYFMKIMALPSLIAPVTNLRNTILIQAALQGMLNVRANRGVIIYVPIPEENLATNGVTAMGEIKSLERQGQMDSHGIFKTISRSMSRKLKSNSTNSRPSVTSTSSWPNTPEAQAAEAQPEAGVRSRSDSKEEEKPRTVKKSTSVRQFVSNRLSDLGYMGETH